MYYIYNFFAVCHRTDLELAVVFLELTSGNALGEHLHQLKKSASFELGKVEIKPDGRGQRKSEEGKCDFGPEISIGGVDQQWRYLDN